MALPIETAFSARQPLTYLALTAAAVASVFLVFAQTSGDAQEVDCDTIQRFVVETGELPRFSIDPDTDTVVVTTSRGECRESTDQWTKRNWLDISKPKQPGARQQPQPRPPPVPRETVPPRPGQTTTAPSRAEPPARPFETHPAFREEPPATEAPAQAEAPRPRPPGECLPLADFWKPGDVVIRNRRYMIARAFTIDDNDDGVVDDVGFRVESKAGQEFDMRYFPRSGALAGKAIEGLRLEDDGVIPRLCFGSVDLLAGRPPEPSSAPPPPPAQAFQVPDLAKEFADRQSGAAPADAPSAEGGVNTRTIVLASAVAGGIIVIAGIALFFTRRMWLPKPKRAEGEEGEDREDDDGDAAEIEETDEGDDEDGEDGDEKPRKKKKRGLFGRKKR